MVNISLKRSEVIDLTDAISYQTNISNGYAFSLATILKKFKKGITDRNGKAYIQYTLDNFIKKNKVPMTTYKKSGK